MNAIRPLFPLLGLLWMPLVSPAQPFPCDGDFIISLYGRTVGGETNTHRVLYDGAGVRFDPLTTTDIRFNGIGYNPVDNFIYGFTVDDNQIIRLRANGDYEIVGSEPEIPIWTGEAGDCSKEGWYAVVERANYKLYLYEVVNGFSQVASVELWWHASTGNSGTARIFYDDIVFNPENPRTLFAFQRNYDYPPGEPVATKGFLLKIDADPDSPDFGAVRRIAYVSENVIRHIGAMFFGRDGMLYGYGASITDPLTQNRLVQIDPETGEARLVNVGPVAFASDGCSCPFSLALEKRAEVLESNCDSIRVEYAFEIINGADVAIPGVTFEDRFTDDWVITGVDPPLPIGGNVAGGSGPGSSTLVYENGTIPADTTIRFTVRASIPAFIGAYSNQAFLETNDPLLGGRIPSDDPDTDAQEDETTFTVDQLPPEVRDTLTAAFCPGGSYQLNGELYTEAGTYDQTLPGAAGDCDTLLTLLLTESDQIRDTLSAAICPGEIYELNGEFYTSAGTYEQTLPAGAGCDTLRTLILEERPFVVADSVTAAICRGTTYQWNGRPYTEPGTYTDIVFADAIGCDSAEILTLQVFDAADSTLSELICPGDVFTLNGENYDRPGNYTQVLEGAAQGGCDSVIQLVLLAEAELELEYTPFVTALPGEPVEIAVTPGFSADSVVWRPAAGLSCTDCLNPTATVERQTNYTVQVFNERGCSATAAITILMGELCRYYIPNAFSPGNGDGVNEVFIIYGNAEVEEIVRLDIFDRWGNQVFSRQNFAPGDEALGWDGTFDGQPAPPGVYAYFAEIRCTDGAYTEKGDVHLVR